MSTVELPIKGAKAICEAVGANHKEIVRLVRDERLPAFRRGGKGVWLALPSDLARWIRAERDRELGELGRAG